MGSVHLAQQLKHDLSNGVIPVNHHYLPAQSWLAQHYGVSRSSIREAMSSLVHQGVISIKQGQRARYTPLNPDQLVQELSQLLNSSSIGNEHYEDVRCWIEMEIAARAARSPNNELLHKLQAATERLRCATTIADAVAADHAFHQSLADATGNQLFTLLYQVLSDMIQTKQYASLSSAASNYVVGDHQRIIAAIRCADEQQARQAMAQHLEQTKPD